MIKIKLIDRLYSQYIDKPNIAALIKIYEDIFYDLEKQIDYVINSYNIDNADKDNLNVLGRIVQIKRPNIEDHNIDEDELYRILIRSKIIKNNKNATIEDILEGLSFILGKTGIKLIDNKDMTFSIEFYFELSDLEFFILENYGSEIIQRPQGVKFKGYVEVIGTTYYGNEDSIYGYVDSEYGDGRI